MSLIGLGQGSTTSYEVYLDPAEVLLVSPLGVNAARIILKNGDSVDVTVDNVYVDVVAKINRELPS